MLVDQHSRPVRDLRISVTDRCNFRCSYCMPEEVFGFKYQFLPRQKILTFEEITRLVRLAVELGVSKVRITGGEPLLRHEIENLIAEIAGVEGIEDIALTTNAYLLADKAARLRDAGLRRLTVSLDTLDPEGFKRLAGKHLDLQRILGGLEAAKAAGFAPIKLNSVVQRGVNDDQILPLARFAREHGYIVRFIEFMDVGNLNGWKMEHVVSAREIIETIGREFPLRPAEKNYKSEVANRYMYADGQGEVGVIASVTQPFCGACTRLRLSAEGKLYTCLFATDGFDVKTLMRQGASDAVLLASLKELWGARTDRYSEQRAANTPPPDRKVEMYHIGG